MKMRIAYITTDKGTKWSTNINGTNADIKKYFMGNYFNVGVYPKESMERVINVSIM